MGSSEKKSKDTMSDIPTFSAENLQNNLKVIQNRRKFLSIIAGVVAGIIGFTGLAGFVFYFVVMLITSVGLIAKAGFSADLYFDSLNRLLFDTFLGGLMRFSGTWWNKFGEEAKEESLCVFSVDHVLPMEDFMETKNVAEELLKHHSQTVDMVIGGNNRRLEQRRVQSSMGGIKKQKTIKKNIGPKLCGSKETSHVKLSYFGWRNLIGKKCCKSRVKRPPFHFLQGSS